MAATEQESYYLHLEFDDFETGFAALLAGEAVKVTMRLPEK